MRSVRCLVLAAMVGLTLAPTGARAAESYTIRTNNGLVARIGAFAPFSKDGSLGAAMRVFGTPSLKQTSWGCVANWKRLRLTINLVNYGVAAAENKCRPSVGLAQSFTVKSSRFRTWEGLRPGAASSTIPERHREAVFREGAWWLRTAISPFGEGEEYAVVSAVVRNGRVTALKGWIGAAGE